MDDNENTSESEYVDALLAEFGYTDDIEVEEVLIDEVWDA